MQSTSIERRSRAGPDSASISDKACSSLLRTWSGRAWMTRPKVVIAGQEYPTHVVKEGSLESTDLTLLSVDENLLPMRLRLRRATLCKAPPWPGQQVVSVVPEETVRSHVISPERMPIERPQIQHRDRRRCPNRKFRFWRIRCASKMLARDHEPEDFSIPDSPRCGKIRIARYRQIFVPASEIASFLPAWTGLR